MAISLFNSCIPKFKSSIINSTTVKTIIDSTVISSDHSLFSLDVAFSNLPQELILRAVGSKWKFLKRKMNLSKKKFRGGVSHLRDSTYRIQ